MLEWIEQLPALPPRPADGHKGTFGTVVVVGGSPLMIGAPALTATAALRSGAGLVKIAASAEVCRAVTEIQPSATGLALENLAGLRDDGKSVLAVGPGWGSGGGGGEAVDALLVKLLDWPNAMVIDADGLNALARHGGVGRPAGLPWVLTPHPGEFRRLAEAFGVDGDPTDAEQRPTAATALARATGAVVVLKGRHTIVTDGRRAYRNETGNAVLATAGTGDVLTGLLAGLIAQGAAAFDAAVNAVNLHGQAADDWATSHGDRGMLAMELADGLPGAIRGRIEGL